MHFEDQMKLRSYLAKHRVNGKLNGLQEAVWGTLNELQDLVHELKRIQAHGLTPQMLAEIDLLVARNSPGWASKYPK